MAGFTFTISGLDGMPRLLDVLTAYPQQFGAALRRVGEIDMTEAKQRTPVKTGALRASGTVWGPMQDGGDLVVVMGFGVVPSVSVAYAVEVHENLEAHHPRGGQAKFLESVVLESAPYLAQRVAEQIEAGAGAQFAPTAAQIATGEAAVSALESDLASAQGEGTF